MAAVRRINTAPELALRRALWALGARYRLYRRELPGSPDLTFVRAKVAVFVDGDFWHGRTLAEKGVSALRSTFRPAQRAFWVAKIKRNRERDRRQTLELQDMGWVVMRVWASDVLANPRAVARRISFQLRRRA